MKKVIFYAASLLLILTFGCKQKTTPSQENATTTTPATQTEEPVSDGHTAETSLDYAGIYTGTIPAASGPGIKITLTINKDKTFKMVSDYIGEKDAVFNDKGTWEIAGNILTLFEKDSAPRYLKVEEGRIKMLNADKEEVTGAMAPNYILKQEKAF